MMAEQSPAATWTAASQCREATEREQMMWCLAEKRNLKQRVGDWIYTCVCCAESVTSNYKLQLNKSCRSVIQHSLLLLIRGRLNQSSCIYSVSQASEPHRETAVGEDKWAGWKKRAVRTPAYDSEDRTTRQREGENRVIFLSPSVPSSSEPSTGGNPRILHRRSVVPTLHHSDAPLQLCVKTVQAAIWLWVMEGGLNSAFEILEPVGKPQLFKCRKSWFYKYDLLWGQASSIAQSFTPPNNPTFIHSAGWRVKEGEGGVGLGGREERMRRRRNHGLFFLHLRSLSPSTCC